MRRASIQRRSLALAALVLAAGALVAGCGVPVAASPDVLSAKSVPDGLLSPPTRPFRQQTTPKGDFDIFLIDTSTTKLVAVARPAVGGLGVQQALNDLLVGPTGSDQFEGLVSYLAPGVPLRATGPNAQGVVTINLGQNFGPNLQPQAVAQMAGTERVWAHTHNMRSPFSATAGSRGTRREVEQFGRPRPGWLIHAVKGVLFV